MDNVAKTTSDNDEIGSEVEAGRWARESLEELFFGARLVAGSARGGLDDEGEKVLAELDHHYAETLSAIRMLEDVLTTVRARKKL